MSTKASMNHYLGGQVKVCVFVPCIFFLLYYSYHSVLPETVSLEMDLRTTYVTRSLSATSLFITNFPFVASCHLRGQSGTWTLGHPAGERGENWLADWRGESWGKALSPSREKNDWQWVFILLADMSTQRWVRREGQNGKRRARMGTTNKVIQTVSPSKLRRGKKTFEFMVALLNLNFRYT